MGKERVWSGILYDPPLHKTLLAEKMFGADISMPVSESIAPRVVSLPIFPEMTDSDVSKTYEAVGKALKNYKRQIK